MNMNDEDAYSQREAAKISKKGHLNLLEGIKLIFISEHIDG